MSLCELYVSTIRKVGIYQREVIRIRISKNNRQHNGQKKKHKRTNNDLPNKGNNKITELRTKGKSKLIIIQTDKISQQPEIFENRNDPDLVQAFLKKWLVESDFKAPNLPLSLRFKGSGCHYNSI